MRSRTPAPVSRPSRRRASRLAFAPAAAQVLAAHPEPRLREWLVAVLALDPRPAYRTGEDGDFGVRLFEFDVRAEIRGGQLTVRELRRAG